LSQADASVSRKLGSDESNLHSGPAVQILPGQGTVEEAPLHNLPELDKIICLTIEHQIRLGCIMTPLNLAGSRKQIRCRHIRLGRQEPRCEVSGFAIKGNSTAVDVSRSSLQVK
jgi:hypothetical protein